MALAFTSGGGGAGAGGTVTSVTSVNNSITVANGTTTPALTVGSVDKLFTNNAPAADLAMNTHKLTGLSAGSGNGDSIRYEQLVGLYLLLAGGTMAGDIAMGTHKISGIGAASAATDAASLANTLDQFGAPGANVAMNTKKLTGLAAGSGAGDSLRYEQVIGSNVLAVSNLVAGTAGQVLQGTGPSYALPPGYEINYTQTTSTVNVVSTTEATGTTLLSPGAITFDGAPVLVHFFCPTVQLDTASAGDVMVISMFEGGTQIGRLAVVKTPSVTSAMQNPVSGFYRFTPTAAAHTYTITAAVSSTTSTPSCGAGAGGTATNLPMFVRFTKV